MELRIKINYPCWNTDNLLFTLKPYSIFIKRFHGIFFKRTLVKLKHEYKFSFQ